MYKFAVNVVYYFNVNVGKNGETVADAINPVSKDAKKYKRVSCNSTSKRCFNKSTVAKKVSHCTICHPRQCVNRQN